MLYRLLTISIATLAAAVPIIEARTAQVLPDSFIWEDFATIDGDVRGNDAFWLERCATLPEGASIIAADLGMVRDFFRPLDGTTMCTYCSYGVY